MLDFARFLTHLNLIFQESTKNIKLVIEQLGPSDVWRDLRLKFQRDLYRVINGEIDDR